MSSDRWLWALFVLVFAALSVLPQSGSDHPAGEVEKRLDIESPTGSGHVPPGSPTDIHSSVSEVPPSAGRTYPLIASTGRNRFKAFIRDSIGGDTLLFEAAGAAITTGRNAPKEWGGGSDGFALRFSSNLGKNFIKQSVTYGLDEAFKVDSTFYRSRDRGIAARFRNSVFSAVTAHDRRGRRVISIPKIAGSLVGNVAAAQFWYPDRYNYVHGLKGAAITLAFDMAHNLIREFVWKK